MNIEEISINKAAWTRDFQGRLGMHLKGMQSIAGHGSALNLVEHLIQELPTIFEKLNIKTLLDVPCGDYYWMNHVPKDGIQYTGCDLVDEQIHWNKKKYPNVDFRIMNMITDEFPYADMIFTRDCFIHLSFKHIKAALDNFKKSKSKYLMVSSLPSIKENVELNGIIGWRFLNLEIEPFNFPTPLILVPEAGLPAPEKYMAIWKLEDIKTNHE